MRLNADGNCQQYSVPVLQPSFFINSAIEVARQLLGKLLIRCYKNRMIGGLILETEAYQGEEDLGCHAKAGLTPRTKVMYGPAGFAYVYFTYGMHWMLNVVTGEIGSPAAVLIRAIKPTMGLELISELRPLRRRNGSQPVENGWTDGPAKLCQALAIDGSMNGLNLCETKSGLWLSDAGLTIPESEIKRSPRIGLNLVPEPWKSIPWRFQWTMQENPRLLDTGDWVQ